MKGYSVKFKIFAKVIFGITFILLNNHMGILTILLDHS